MTRVLLMKIGSRRKTDTERKAKAADREMYCGRAHFRCSKFASNDSSCRNELELCAEVMLPTQGSSERQVN